MNLFQHTLHIFHSDMEEIRGRLSLCQTYSNTLNIPHIEKLRTILNETNSPLSQFREVKKYLRAKKDVIVKFYSLDKKNYISVCSDFFSHEGAFDMSKFYFEDLDVFVMAISCADSQCLLSIILGQAQVGSFTFDLEHMGLDDIVSIIGTYVDPPLWPQYRIDIVSIYEIFNELKSAQTLSDEEALQLLKENSQIDEFIL